MRSKGLQVEMFASKSFEEVKRKVNDWILGNENMEIDKIIQTAGDRLTIISIWYYQAGEVETGS